MGSTCCILHMLEPRKPCSLGAISTMHSVFQLKFEIAYFYFKSMHFYSYCQCILFIISTYCRYYGAKFFCICITRRWWTWRI